MTDKEKILEEIANIKYQLSKKILELINSLQEEPVSDDLEEVAEHLSKIYAGEGSADPKREGCAFYIGFKNGAKWQENKDESYSNDLGDYIDELSKQFPEVSFAKLSRIAVRAAKWQKQQDQSTIDAKNKDFERELSKYVSNGIHRFFPNEGDDYYNMDSVVWQDYVIETAKHFYSLGLAQKGE